MKIEPRQAERFLRDPGAIRAVLLHGEDDDFAQLSNGACHCGALHGKRTCCAVFLG